MAGRPLYQSRPDIVIVAICCEGPVYVELGIHWEVEGQGIVKGVEKLYGLLSVRSMLKDNLPQIEAGTR